MESVKVLKNKKSIFKHNIFFLIVMLLLVAYAVSLILPLIWGLTNSFKSAFDFDTNRLGLPKPFTLDN